jgi:aminopeptidase N
MTRLNSILLAAALTALPAIAQTLPDGEPHTYRTRAYDILHYRADLTVDPGAGRIAGHATITLAPFAVLENLALDAIGLEVKSVTIDDATPVDFKTEGHQLEIQLPAARPPGEPFTLTVAYAATPDAGMYFQPDRKDGDRVFVHTYGEGGMHANWLPIYNDTNDHFPTEMVIRVPRPYVAISNGVLVETTEDGEHATYHWRQELPHPNYLISIYVGDFEMGTLAPAFGEIPLRYWVPRGRLAEGAYTFRNTTRMVEHYSERLGYRYPWDKYDQIAVPDYAVGAMEHTGVTGHRDCVLRLEGEAPLDFGGPTFSGYWTDWSAEATISHELAHHWFGDNLTCRSLNQIWLNESFASYLMMLWDEESVSYDQLVFDVELARRHYLGYVAEKHLIRPLEYDRYDDASAIYNVEHTYLKGATVLHQLRAVVGDETFFRSLSVYLKRHEFSNVESDDLRRVFEEVSGRNLAWFWDDWVTGGGHPVFEVSYRYLPDRQMIDLSIAQVQPLVTGQGLFKLPVEVTVVVAGKTLTETVWVEEASHQVLLPAAAEPLLVSFDGGGQLMAEIRFDKDVEELVYQASNDALVGRLRALGQLAARFPTRPETLATFDSVLSSDAFWALRAEAAQLLGQVRTAAAEKLAEKALAASDYRIRKAAVLGLTHFGSDSTRRRLTAIVDGDSHSDVVGTAIVALARSDSSLDAAFLKKQLERDSWYDEIRIAALEAATELGRPELVELARPYTGEAWNQHLRRSALDAWAAAAPTDKELHGVLLELAQGPILSLRIYALEKLGALYVESAVPLLEEVVKRDVDRNLTVRARAALKEIRRIRK